MKTMTSSDMKDLLVVIGVRHPLGAKQIAEHIAALEAEAAQARERALEEMRPVLSAVTRATADMSTEDVCRIADAIKPLYDALKSKPAQESIGTPCDCGGVPYTHEAGEDCMRSESGEMASEENGLLPPKRRREHEYGEEHRGIFGEYVAHCTRPPCQAHRIKTRGMDATMFRQSDLSDTTDEPGPCEVEP